MSTLSFGIEALVLLPINEHGGAGTETQENPAEPGRQIHLSRRPGAMSASVV